MHISICYLFHYILVFFSLSDAKTFLASFFFATYVFFSLQNHFCSFATFGISLFLKLLLQCVHSITKLSSKCFNFENATNFSRDTLMISSFHSSQVLSLNSTSSMLSSIAFLIFSSFNWHNLTCLATHFFHFFFCFHIMSATSNQCCGKHYLLHITFTSLIELKSFFFTKT